MCIVQGIASKGIFREGDALGVNNMHTWDLTRTSKPSTASNMLYFMRVTHYLYTDENSECIYQNVFANDSIHSNATTYT